MNRFFEGSFLVEEFYPLATYRKILTEKVFL